MIKNRITHNQFLQLKTSAFIIKTTAFTVRFIKSDHFKLAIGIRGKYACAVKRNLIKRRIKACSHDQKLNVPFAACLITCLPPILNLTFKTLQEQLLDAFKTIKQIAN